MKYLKDLDVIDSSVLYNIEIDYYLNSIRLYVRTLDHGVMRFYELNFKKILIFSIKNKYTYPSINIEIDEIQYEKNGNIYKFCLLIWSENYTIDIECEDWSLRLLEEYNENE